MNAPLYNNEILRLAAAAPFSERLPDPMASVEKRSPICGSRVTVDLNVDAAGRVTDIGLLVRACALGQASASILGGAVLGRSLAELAQGRAQLRALLDGAGNPPATPFDALEIFTPAVPHRARHASILLAWDAVVEAVQQATGSAAA